MKRFVPNELKQRACAKLSASATLNDWDAHASFTVGDLRAVGNRNSTRLTLREEYRTRVLYMENGSTKGVLVKYALVQGA